MREEWREDYERDRLQLLEEIDTVFEAASLGYLNDEVQMTEGLYGKMMDDYGDGVLRLSFANWHSKSRIVIEKPLAAAPEAHKKSIFSDESKEIAFNFYIFDLLQENIAVDDSSLDLDGDVEFLQIEIYNDAKLALIYLGRPYDFVTNNRNEDDEEDSYDNQSGEYDEDNEEEDEYMPMPEGFPEKSTIVLGAEFSEQGMKMHNKIRHIIRGQLGIDFWAHNFSNSLSQTIDDYTQFLK